MNNKFKRHSNLSSFILKSCFIWIFFVYKLFYEFGMIRQKRREPRLNTIKEKIKEQRNWQEIDWLRKKNSKRIFRENPCVKEKKAEIRHRVCFVTHMHWLCTCMIHLVENIAGSENFLLVPNFPGVIWSFILCAYFVSLLQNGNLNCFSEIALVIGVYLYSHLRFRIRSWTLEYGKIFKKLGQVCSKRPLFVSWQE